MPDDESSEEIARIRTAYDGYREIADKKWSRENRGNLAMLAERDSKLLRLLRDAGQWPPRGKKVLDVGCGGGELLALFAAHGATESDLHGVDLLPARIEHARRRLPGARFTVANGAQLDFPPQSFDLVTLFLVFSSILSPEMTRQLAGEVRRLLKPGGAIVIYDFRVPSPGNRQVRPVRRGEVEQLFAGCSMRAVSLTVLPPVARHLGPFTTLAYPLLALFPFLRTHNLYVLRPGTCSASGST